MKVFNQENVWYCSVEPPLSALGAAKYLLNG